MSHNERQIPVPRKAIPYTFGSFACGTWFVDKIQEFVSMYATSLHQAGPVTNCARRFTVIVSMFKILCIHCWDKKER